MTRKIKSFVTLIIIGLLVMSCSSTNEKTVETEIAETGTAQNSIPIGNNQSNNKDVKKTPSTKSDEAFLNGKYIISEIGFSGEHSLELKSKNVAVFKIVEEDGFSNGTGTWSWDQTAELLKVTLTVKTQVAGDLEDKPTISKASFQLKKNDKNLKIIKDGWSPDKIYVGKVFKRIS